MSGDNHTAAAAAALPANPSRDKMPAVVHVGAAPAAANNALDKPASFSFISPIPL
jgi:hypothetical protein